MELLLRLFLRFSKSSQFYQFQVFSLDFKSQCGVNSKSWEIFEFCGLEFRISIVCSMVFFPNYGKIPQFWNKVSILQFVHRIYGSWKKLYKWKKSSYCITKNLIQNNPWSDVSFLLECFCGLPENYFFLRLSEPTMPQMKGTERLDLVSTRKSYPGVV